MDYFLFSLLALRATSLSRTSLIKLDASLVRVIRADLRFAGLPLVLLVLEFIQSLRLSFVL